MAKESQETNVEKKKDDRARNFATVVYPDSAPDNWREILAEQFIPAFISPLHDRDLNPNGEPKKPHYHVMVMFEGKKSEEQVELIFNLIKGVGLEKIQSMRGYGRYLCHLDNPEKAQYSQADVQSLCGADYVSVINLVTDKYKAVREIVAFCKNYDICSYSQILEYAMEEREDWFRVLCDSGTYVVKEYLKSRQWMIEKKYNQIVNSDGEIV